MDTGETDTHVIFCTRVEWALIHKHQRLVVVDQVGVFVVEGDVGRDVQAAGSIAIVRGELLLQNAPVTAFAVAHAEGRAGGALVLAIDVFTNVVGVSRALVVTHTVFARQAVDLRRPDQLHRQYGALGTAAAEFEAVTVLQLRRVLVVSTDLRIQLRRDVVLHADSRLADRPVVPGVDIVTDLGATERQVLEVAREGVEVFAFTEVTELHVQLVVEHLVLNPELGQTHHVATAINFLRRTQGAGTRVTNTVIGDVRTITVGQLDLGLGVIPAPQLLQIQCYAETELVSVTGSFVVVVATAQVGANFPNVVSLDVDTLLDQLGTLAAPIAGHPLGIGTESIVRHRIGGQYQGCCR